MPISLIRSNKDNVVHGSDNGKTTGCRLRCQSVGYTKEGEMNDIVDLTCDRCKEYFARKMIRESNREEARITKEEKKRFEKAKKQGMVKESSFEEYQINREFEESERRATQGQRNNLTATQQMMQNGGYQYFGNNGAEQTDMNQPNGVSPANDQVPAQPDYNTYGQPESQPAPENNSGSIPVYQPYNAYGQASAPAQATPENTYGQPNASAPQQFNSYGQTAVNQAPQQQYNAYGQTPVQPQSQQFGAYGQAQPMNNFGMGDIPTVPEIQPGGYQNYNSDSMKANSSKSDDDFLAQFMADPSVVNAQPQAPAKESVNTSSILSAANDILSQYNTEPPQMSGMDAAPKTPSFNGDASSFFSNQVPVVDSGFPSIESLSNSSNEFGSIIGQDSYSDIPVVQAPADNYVRTPQANQINSISDFSSASPSYTTYSSQNYASAGNQYETVTPPNTFGNTNNVQSFENLGPAGVDAFGSINSSQFGGMNAEAASLESVRPVDTSSLYGQTQNMNQSGFVMPSMDQPSAQPEMYQPSFANQQPENTSSKIPVYTPPVYNSQQYQNSYAQPADNTYQQPVQNTYTQPNQNIYAQSAQNNVYGQQNQNMYTQPVQNTYGQPAQNTYGQAVQNTFNSAMNQNVQSLKKEIRNDVPIINNSGAGEMADSIEAALRQLGAEGVAGPNLNGQNNAPEKEEIVPNYVAYVSSASKVLHNAPPANSAAASAPKKMMSAREAKKLAKIDDKFYQDLKKRGYANEMRSQRRGK